MGVGPGIGSADVIQEFNLMWNWKKWGGGRVSVIQELKLL